MTRVSVIMAAGGSRPEALENVLNSWSRVTHKDLEFILIYSGLEDESDYEVVKNLVAKHKFITTFEKSMYGKSTFASTSRIWHDGGKKSTGEYIVFAMADEILRDYDLLEIMLAVPKEKRTSVATFFLNPTQTEQLKTINWLDNPRLIEELPDFWTHCDFEGAPNTTRGGAVVCHISGAWREYWEWLGWHRDDEFGYLNLDQDIIVRENFLGRWVLDVSTCYHQWHGAGNAYVPDEHRLSPYIYTTEAQAKLLEPAERWKP
jgi:hypothetical protein